MNIIWQTVEPYILTVVGALGGGSIIYVIARILLGRFVTKAASVYDINVIANMVADKLGGKTINIDIASIVEKRLKEISEKLAEQVSNVADVTNSYKPLLVLIGTALTHLKMLTDEERAALVAAIRELDSEYTPPEKDVIATVKLEPIRLNEPSVDTMTDTVNLA